jgi:hypothetical protein
VLFSAWDTPAKIPATQPAESSRSAAIGLPPPPIGYVETVPIHIDQIYPSMQGPHDRIVVNTSDSNSEGFKTYPDHTYRIEASYSNETDHDIDAMAVISFYSRSW